MTRAASFYAVLTLFGITSFAACSSGDSDPIGDTLDGSPRTNGTSGSRGTSGTFDGTSSNGSNPSSSGSSGRVEGDCLSSLDCIDKPGQECLPGEGDALFCTDVGGADGGSSGASSSGGGSSGSNPGGAGVGEPCDADADCESNLCVTSKNTGVLFCSMKCTKGADNYDPLNPNDATNCPVDLPRCGNEAGRPDTVCRADI